MQDPYLVCPVLENDSYLLRLVNEYDARDLLEVYSDLAAVPYFNSDNCNGDTFYYPTLERMEQAIQFWLREYGQRYYVRWTIIEKCTGAAVGTVELFNRQADDFFTDCGLLRLDLKSSSETEEHICQLLSLVVPPAFGLFGCSMIATKIPVFAINRQQAACRIGFVHSPEKLQGHDGREYGDYYVLYQTKQL